MRERIEWLIALLIVAGTGGLAIWLLWEFYQIMVLTAHLLLR